MTSTPPPAGPPGAGPGGPGEGRLRPTTPRSLVGFGVVGLVGGWLLRPGVELLGAVPPLVTWAQPGALLLVAAILGIAAWATHRSVHVHHQRLAPHQAVNRLVLARACALVGALVAGVYAGYAVSWLGLEAGLAGQRSIRAGVAALAGLAICATGLLLERACRVRDDDPAS